MTYFAQLLSAQAHALRLPDGAKERAELFVLQHSGGGTTPERAPFRRQLDFWAFAMAVAVAKELAPKTDQSSKWGKKFADTRSVQLSDDLCDMLAVLAFTELGIDHEDLDNPAMIIEIGNRFADAGTALVLRELEDPGLRITTLEKMLDFASSLLEAEFASVPEVESWSG